MDLGDCSKVHELALRADYQKAAKNKEYYYELDVSTVVGVEESCPPGAVSSCSVILMR